MNIKPKRDYVLIKKKEEDEKTKSGLIIKRKNKEREKMFQGTVLDVGEGRYLNNGEKLPLSVEKGDEILYKQYTGFKINDNKWLIHINDIVACVEKEG